MPDDCMPRVIRPVVDMGEFSPYAGSERLCAFEVEAGGLRLLWHGGEDTFFHFIWLRDHCACSDCRHPATRERTFDLIELPEELPAPEAGITTEGALRLVWPAMGKWPRHESRFDPAWLWRRRHGAMPVARPRVRPWTAADMQDRVPRLSFDEVMESDAGLLAWLEFLGEYGLVLLTGGPCQGGEVERLARRVGPIRETNFGGVFDVISKPKPNNAAYTALALEPHADLPNWRRAPDFQLLYCLENSATGGSSLFSDAFAAVEQLRTTDAEAFEILATTPIDFRFQDEETDVGHRAPVIGLDGDGRLAEVRINNWIRDSLDLPADRVVAFYRAYKALRRLVRDPAFVIRLRLEPGQMAAFDNLRVLHGREAFDANSGRRHLQGCYLDRDFVESKRRVLRRG